MDFPQIEEKILKFWKEKKIFEKSLKKTKKGKRFVFFEGPPFANGLPGIHHLLSRAFKDVILRYKTMQGFSVERKAGWDTHGLPTEMEAEKKLGIKSKKDIEKIGIKKFIETCQNSVFTYKKEWEDFTERIGFWLDLKNAYITCSNDYIESLWWILKKIWEKGLLYQDYKVVPYCPRCGTSLSSHEVAQGYKKISEPAIFLKLKIKNKKSKTQIKNKKFNTFLLVWTTTPWTLPANVALAVNPKFIYAKVKVNNEYLILAKERFKACGVKGKIVEEIKGKKLLELEYEPLFDFMKTEKPAFKVVAGDFISTEEGTGIVHIAPAFGEEDMEVGKQNDLPILITVNEDGTFKKEVKPWAGKFVKDADPEITASLQKRNLLYKKELYEHDYPFCWRCDSPLLYYAKTSWFIKMSGLRKKLLENNKKINWIPDYLKDGRFGEWLREVKDWNLSRERYWGTPLPIWQCEKCDKQICVGSLNELKKLQVTSYKLQDLHRPSIDKATFKCEKCGGLMRRIPEVVDCWFDSGSMPYAQWHYPFENKEKIDKKNFFPADFICEGIDQTRGWFYTLLAVSTLLNLGPAYKNVISHGIVLDAKGQKMSKSKGNVVWPKDVIDKFGADSARFYFYTINPAAEPKRFDFKDVQEISRRFLGTLWNSYLFFSTYTDKKFKPQKNFSPKNLLDKWIVSQFQNLCQQIIENLDKYYVVEATRLFEDFVDDLSNWYIRRSRKRFQRPETKEIKEEASQTLYYVLLKLTKLIAPFTPFIAEELYQKLNGAEKSVHLCDYPEPDKKLINSDLEEKMEQVREVVTQSLGLRAEAGIRVRQPLKELRIRNQELRKAKGLLDLIKDEVNVKKITFGEEIELDTKITKELKEEGVAREVIRHIQALRKKAGLKPKDKILVQAQGPTHLNKILNRKRDFILKETLAKDFKLGEELKIKFEIKKEAKVNKETLWLGIKKI